MTRAWVEGSRFEWSYAVECDCGQQCVMSEVADAATCPDCGRSYEIEVVATEITAPPPKAKKKDAKR